MTTTTLYRPPADPRPSWVGPCRCRQCAELATVPVGLEAAHRWPAPHTEAAEALLAAWREVQRRRAERC